MYGTALTGSTAAVIVPPRSAGATSGHVFALPSDSLACSSTINDTIVAHVKVRTNALWLD